MLRLFGGAGLDSADAARRSCGATLTYDTNRLTDDGTRTFSYNGLGARLGDGTYTYSYDAFGNLTSVQNGGTVYECDYDPFGRRFRTGSGSGTHFFLFDGDAPYVEYTYTGGVVRRFYWGLTGPVCQRMPSGSNHWYVADGRGDTRALLNDTGTITDTATYNAWGEQLPGYSSGTTDNPFRWNGSAGYTYVNSTGLYHAGARVYDPTVGRWLQRDPIAMAGGHPNLYVYCGNSPVEGSDSAGTGSELNPLFPLALNAAINNGDGPLGEAAEEEASVVGQGLENAAMDAVEPVVTRVASRFSLPGWDWHHVIPTYLINGDHRLLVQIPQELHQAITSYCRVLWPYGQGPVTDPAELLRILDELYSKFPILGNPVWYPKGWG